MSPCVIALSGAIGVGKSTIAKRLEESLLTSAIVPVSMYVYQASESVYEFLDIDFEKNRALLQAIGDIGRSIDDNYWIRNMVNYVKREYVYERNGNRRKLRDCRYIIVPDIRYPNEIEYLRKCYPNVIHVLITGSHKPETTSHNSETALKDYLGYDMIINGDSNPDDIATNIISYMTKKVNETF